MKPLRRAGSHPSNEPNALVIEVDAPLALEVASDDALNQP